MKENKVAELLIKLRKEFRFTQSDLADRLDVSYQAVSKWERGENLPDAYTLVALAKVYGITVDEILNGELIKREDQLSINKRKKLFMIIGVMTIVMSPIIIFMYDVEDYNSYIPILLASIAIGIGLLIYASVSSQPYAQTSPKTREQRRKEEIIYAICAGIFMVLGLVFDLFQVAWVVFIFGYAATLIVKKDE